MMVLFALFFLFFLFPLTLNGEDRIFDRDLSHLFLTREAQPWWHTRSVSLMSTVGVQSAMYRDFLPLSASRAS